MASRRVYPGGFGATRDVKRTSAQHPAARQIRRDKPGGSLSRIGTIEFLSKFGDLLFARAFP